MLTVYRVFMDVDRYQYFMTDDKMFFERYKFDGESYAEEWKPPEIYIYKPRKKVPDFWAFSGTLGFAVARELYMDIPLLDRCGEMLTLDFEGKEMLFFNCTNVINALDKKRAVYDPEMPNFIDEYAFVPGRLNQTLFRIPETTRELFAIEGLAGPDDEFKSVVERMKLKGIIFDKVWSEDD